MRKEPNLRLEKYRDNSHELFTSPAGVNYGAFVVEHRGVKLTVFSSGTDEESGWEHVSVSLRFRTPTWEEMCLVKDLFWRDDEVVLQFHPAKKDYVNNHDHCLHMWRPLKQEIQTPPTQTIGLLDQQEFLEMVKSEDPTDWYREASAGLRGGEPDSGGPSSSEGT